MQDTPGDIAVISKYKSLCHIEVGLQIRHENLTDLSIKWGEILEILRILEIMEILETL